MFINNIMEYIIQSCPLEYNIYRHRTRRPILRPTVHMTWPASTVHIHIVVERVWSLYFLAW